MDLTSILSAAAAEAQSILAPISDPEGRGEFTFGGADYTGTMNEQDEEDPLDVAGIKRVRQLYIYATKPQFDSAPTAAPRATLTAKGATWSVQSITDLPQHYRFVCRRV